MPNVKTAISLEKPLFDQVEALARKMNVSRSRLFGLAVKDFTCRYQNRDLLARINAAYEDDPDPSEQALFSGMRQRHREIVDGE